MKFEEFRQYHFDLGRKTESKHDRLTAVIKMNDYNHEKVI